MTSDHLGVNVISPLKGEKQSDIFQSVEKRITLNVYKQFLGFLWYYFKIKSITSFFLECIKTYAKIIIIIILEGCGI